MVIVKQQAVYYSTSSTSRWYTIMLHIHVVDYNGFSNCYFTNSHGSNAKVSYLIRVGWGKGRFYNTTTVV